MKIQTPSDLLSALLWNDLAAFIHRSFQTTNPGQELLVGHHIRAMALSLMRVAYGKTTRLVITMPPRSLKSHCVSVAFTAWLLGRDPAARIIAASYAAELAEEFSLQTRSVMEADWYKKCFPLTAFHPKQSTIKQIRTTKHGFRLATSVGGTLTGKGGDLLIIDDPLKAGEACSEAARQEAKDWLQTTALSRLDNPKSGGIVLVAQRLNEDDLAGFVLEHGGWEHLNLPAIAEKDEEIPIADADIWGGSDVVWHRKKGDLLEPERVGEEQLEQIRKELGTANFEAQYQQRPAPPGGNLVKLKWFNWYDIELALDASNVRVQSWDPANVAGDGNDYSVCTTWGISGDQYYLLDVYRDRLNYPDLRKKAIELQAKFQPKLVVVEKAGNGISLYQDLVADGHDWIDCLKPAGDKISRLSHQSAKIEAGRVHLLKNAKWLDAFVSEVTAFPNGKYDDQVDSMSQFLRTMDIKKAHHKYLNK